MDYNFEAPTYVNFAEAMDEDEAEVSRYFDVEHEESFAKVKGTPGVILPEGPRDIPSAKKTRASGASTSTPARSKDPVEKTSMKGPAPAKAGRKSNTPAKVLTPARFKTPLKTKTPGSVKRLQRSSYLSVTPGKVAAALTALQLTPAKIASAVTSVVPGSAKRSRLSTEEPHQLSPSKRARMTPSASTEAAAELVVSPSTMIEELVNYSLKMLSSSKKNKSQFNRRLSIVDGIEVELPKEKMHTMETRADKVARDPPIQLRSRSVCRTERKEELYQPQPPARIRSQSRDRNPVPAPQPRSRSIDRVLKLQPPKAVKATEPFISLAEATRRFQNRTPQRFRMKPKNSSGVKNKGPLLALRPTIPQSPALRVKHRSRPVSALSREEQEAQELEEIRKHKIKPLPLPEKILKPINPVVKIEKKPPTQPEPFNITEVKKKDPPVEEPVKFTARPVPKKMLEGPVGLGEKKQYPLTDPKSPSFRANALQRSKNCGKLPTPIKTVHKITLKVLEDEDGVQVVKEKQLGHLGIPFMGQPTKSNTEFKPFSFEARDKNWLQRKEEKLKELQEQLSKKTVFHANPVPSFKTPPRRIRSPSPAAGHRMTPGSQPVGNVVKKPVSNVPEPKAALLPQFKARAPTVLQRKPFEPVKPNRQLPLPDVTLASELRAKERELFEQQQMERELEVEALRQQLKAEQERKEKEEIALLRKNAVHKSNPVPKVKPFEPQPSEKPLTDPSTPFCLKRSLRKSAV